MVGAAAAWGTVAGAHLARSSRHDVPTSEVGLAGTQLSSTIYGTVVFDLTFFNEVTKSDNILKSIEANVIDSCIEVIFAPIAYPIFAPIG